MSDNLYAYSFTNDVNLCDFGTCFNVSSGALTTGELYPEIGQIRDGGYASPPSSSVYVPAEIDGADSLVFDAYLSEAATVSVDVSTISTCTNTATGYDMFNFGYQLLIIEKDVVLDRVGNFDYVDTEDTNTQCNASFTSNWTMLYDTKTYNKVLSGTGVDRIPVGTYQNTAPPYDLLTVKYFVPVGDKYTYVGFGGSTGAFVQENWIHDFIWTSEFNSITMSDILTNSNLINSAVRVGNSIRLTPAEGDKVGNFFYNIPVFISNNRGRLIDWSAYFVTSMGGGTRGDGITFILQNTNNIGGVTGGGVGYGNIRNINSIGVVYDTYRNLEIDEPSDNYMKLCVSGNMALPLATQVDLGFDLCGSTGVSDYRYNWIVYTGRTKTIDVYISTTPIKPAEPKISFFIDIRNNVVAN